MYTESGIQSMKAYNWLSVNRRPFWLVGLNFEGKNIGIIEVFCQNKGVIVTAVPSCKAYVA